jgi:hypothetical protein
VSGAEFKSGKNDAALIAGIRSGDESAMAQLYDRYSSIVYAVAPGIERLICSANAFRKQTSPKSWSQ